MVHFITEETQLALKQHIFELHGFTYTQIFTWVEGSVNYFIIKAHVSPVWFM